MSIQVNVDLTNPGQFFACCGLLEIAQRFSREAEGFFGTSDFFINSPLELNGLFEKLADCELTNTMTTAEQNRFDRLRTMSSTEKKDVPGFEEEYKELSKLRRESPIVLRLPIGLTVDWFIDDFAGGSRFKTWAGQQSVLDIARAMKDALKGSDWRNEKCLNFSATDCGLPFNFDSDLGGQGGAVDVGFSFDPLAGSALTRIQSSARPVLELLAFIGLQRFRPSEIKGQNRFVYTAWKQPLPIEVAAPAASGVMPVSAASRFEFRLLYRTKYLKSFLPAVPFTGGSDE